MTNCPRCDSKLIGHSEYCFTCGTGQVNIGTIIADTYKTEEFRIKEKFEYKEEVLSEPKIEYRKTEAGKAAWNRYRYSNLFYEAHARHRKTKKYRDTQERYHKKQRLYKQLFLCSNGIKALESTCPLNLFYKGPNDEIYNNIDKCDYINGDCKLLCID